MKRRDLIGTMLTLSIASCVPLTASAQTLKPYQTTPPDAFTLTVGRIDCDEIYIEDESKPDGIRVVRNCTEAGRP